MGDHNLLTGCHWGTPVAAFPLNTDDNSLCKPTCNTHIYYLYDLCKVPIPIPNNIKIYLKKQNPQLNSAHNMNNTSENGWLLKWPIFF